LQGGEEKRESLHHQQEKPKVQTTPRLIAAVGLHSDSTFYKTQNLNLLWQGLQVLISQEISEVSLG
jgi:hypothetical protein